MAKVQKITGLQTWWKLLDMTETATASKVQSTKSTCYRNLTWQNKAWQYSTKCVWQKSLTDHKPKRTRRYDGNHVNTASFVNRFQTWQKTEHGRNRHYEGIFVSLMYSPQSNAWQNKHTYSKKACLWSYPWQEKVYSMYETTTTTSLAKLNNT